MAVVVVPGRPGESADGLAVPRGRACCCPAQARARPDGARRTETVAVPGDRADAADIPARRRQRRPPARSSPMRVTFLGTAADHPTPEPWCACATCAAARRLGGRDVRLRSAALVNDNLLLDAGPDVPAAVARLGRGLA